MRVERRGHYDFNINLIDVAIAVAVILAIGNGFKRGFSLSLMQYTGLLLGVVMGAAAAPRVADLLHIEGQLTRPLSGVIVLVTVGSVGSSLGYWLGEPLRRRFLRSRDGGEVDSMAGAAFSLLAVLAVCWFLGLSFSRGPVASVSNQIQHSTMLAALDRIFPRPPGFLAGVEKVLSGVPFPQTFSALAPSLPAPLPVPASVDTAGVQHVRGETVRVVSHGAACPGLITGSGFPTTGGYVLTNAHVVAGTRNTVVQTPAGRSFDATVVLFDPNRDVALLLVPNLKLPALPAGPGPRGTSAAVVGYPGGGPETVSPAVIDGTVVAEGRDIYNQNLVTRQIHVFQSNVQPGNSGGPIADLKGNVLGVVFAASTSQEGQAYALTDQEVQPDIDAAQGRTDAVDVGAQCAV